MCGIFGFSQTRDIQLDRALQALNTLTHRGPDQWNEYHNESVYLGHRRLSILDLSENGKQPMSNADLSIWITVNGEIYNFKSLREELLSKYTFISTSDSEVLVHGYTEWGIDGLLDRIDGMFAFVIYDSIKRKIFLARDRVGIKPLYYTAIDGLFSWASELKAIRTYVGSNNLEYDYTALYDFLTYQYIPAPKTLYIDVHKLPPAHYIEFDISSRQYEIMKYWQLDTREKKTTINEAGKILYQLVQKSISEQMVSDVPVGFFLSGGMDSSTIVGLAQELSEKVSTFTIGFSGDMEDETHFAKEVATFFKTQHRTEILDGSTAASMFTKIEEWYDEPFADISCFPTFLVSRIAREQVTVVLTGDGGDELFAGYKWYGAFSLVKKLNLRAFRFMRPLFAHAMYKEGLIGRLAKRIEWLFLNDLELYTRLMGGLLHGEKKKMRELWGIEETYDDYWYFRKYYNSNLPVTKRLQYLDFHTYLPDDILTKVDRVSMAVSLECRVPFLSKEIIEYVFSLSQSVICFGGKSKGLMKYAFRNLLPSSILSRDKKGFNVPIREWRQQLYSKYKTRHFKILKDVFGISVDSH